MLQFYSSPGSSGFGMRVLLEESGAAYQVHRLNLAAKEQLAEPFRSINPKGKVPALVREDGTLVTEFQTIAFWLADAYPEAGLLPRDAEGRMRAMEIMDFIVASLHMRGFTFVLMPGKFTQTPDFQAELTAYGKDQIAIGFGHVSDVLGDQDYLLGDFSVADGALFYTTRWAVAVGLDLPTNVAAHHNRMLTRPAVQRAIEAEGVTVGQAG